jgi:hypothetical protein
MESSQMPIERVKLLLQIDGIGKKCYATAKVTNEKGAFPNKEYYTTNKLKYVGLYVRDENSNGSFRKYFQHPMTQEEIFYESINPLVSISSPSQKDGFVEVQCIGNRINSLQNSSRRSFQNYVKQQPETDHPHINDFLQKQNMYDIVYPPVKRSNGGKKRRRTTRKRPKRKSRKKRRKSIRR